MADNPLPDGLGAPPLRLRAGPAHAGLRADAFLTLELPFLSRARIRQKIQTGESLLNGRRFASSARIREGDEIVVAWRSAPDRRPAPALPVLYEDDFLIAVDKPAGMASHPGGGRQSGTVAQFLRQRFEADVQSSLQTGGDFFPSLVNRLDVFTSGIILAAKTGSALRALQALVAARGVDKTYAALVEGNVERDEGTIDLPLGPDPQSATEVRMAVRSDGAPCVTEFRVVRRLAGCTLLSIRPVTGRQHQIRAHCAAIGHPVWGDLLYKDERLFLRWRANGGTLDDSLPPRHCLHAVQCSFCHPVTGRGLSILSPIPADFAEIVARYPGR